MTRLDPTAAMNDTRVDERVFAERFQAATETAVEGIRAMSFKSLGIGVFVEDPG